jgi:hypothetical protein
MPHHEPMEKRNFNKIAGTSRREPRLLRHLARNLRKHVIGIAADQPDRTDHNDKDHRQHHCIFGDVLPLLFAP